MVGWKVSTLGAVACALTMLTPVGAPRALVLDSFTVSQAELSVVGFTSDTSQVINASIFGGDRDLGILGGALSVGSSSTEISGGHWTYDGTGQTGANGPSPGLAVTDYDGPGNGNAFIGGNGLGGVDLTNGGTDNAFLVRIDTYSANFAAGVARIAVFALDTHVVGLENATINLTEDIVGPTDIIVPFSAFSGAVDFTTIGEIRLQLQGHEMAFSVDSFETISVTEPVSMALFGLVPAFLAWRRAALTRRPGHRARRGP